MDEEGFYDSVVRAIESGNLDHAKEQLQSKNEPKYVVLKAQIAQRESKYDETLELSSKVIADPSATYQDILKAYYWIGWAHANRGNYETAKAEVEQGLRILQQHEKKHDLYVQKVYLYNILGIILKESGLPEKGLEYTRLGLDLARELDNMGLVTTLTNNLASAHFFRGEYQEALTLFKEGVELAQRISRPYTEAIALGNIGEIYQYLANYDLAREYLERSMRAHERLNNSKGIAVTKRKLGEILLLKGQLSQARQLVQESIDIYKQIDYPFFLCFSYYAMGKIKLALGEDIEELKFDMDAIAKQSKNQILIQLHNLLVAFELKQTDSMLHRGQALRYLERITAEKTLMFEITYEASIHYIELLIQEYMLTGVETKLGRIIDLVERINKQALEKNATLKVIESLILKSKLEAISLNMPQAMECLRRAKKISEEEHLSEFTRKVDEELKIRHDELDRYHNLINTNSSLLEKIQYSGLMDYMNTLVKTYKT